MGLDIGRVVPSLLAASRHISGVELRGSRATGTANRYSDWDFVVATSDFDAVTAELPSLVGDLDPLVQQWDRLSEYPCYMLIVDGPTKIDLIFEGIPHDDDGPWAIDATTLPLVDGHFWDWTLWLTSKIEAGKTEQVNTELAKMHDHLLAPMEVIVPPTSLRQAVEQYTTARDLWSHRLGVTVSRRLERAVLPVVLSLSHS